MLRHEGGRERALVIGLLDEFQAAERVGADALGRWIAVCVDPRLRGGLRVIRARDAGHAALVTARLRALGGVPAAEPSRELEALCGVVAAEGVSDRSKIATLVARFPAAVHDPLAELVARIEGDDETRALLQTIADDERVSLRWLRHMAELVAREAG